MPQIVGQSSNEPGIIGTSDKNDGVRAVGKDGNALSAHGTNNVAIYAKTTSATKPAVYADSPNTPALVGISDKDDGVRGVSKGGVGVSAHSANGDALVAHAKSSSKSAVFGRNDSKVNASAPGGSGVFGLTLAPGAAGVFGANNHTGTSGVGVQGNGPEAGVSGWSEKGIGVRALSKGVGLFAQGGKGAAEFVGDVKVTGSIEVTGDVRLANADCAEAFDIAAADVQPGTVMVFDEHGELRPCDCAYDKKVAGVVSGAGSYRPALVLDQQETGRPRQPVALMGKVYCQVDASYGPVAVGDLLTTSPTQGAAMTARDPGRAFGSVIGKALKAHREGIALIPILVSLQ